MIPSVGVLSGQLIASRSRLLGLGLLALWAGACGITVPDVDEAKIRAVAPGKRILIVVTSHPRLDRGGGATGYWLSEVAHFYEVVHRAGFSVDFTSPAGGLPPVDPASRDLDDESNAAFVADAAVQARLSATVRPETLDAADYAAIYFAGGHGPLWDLPDNRPLQTLTRGIYERGGLVAAVCHGPAGLLNVTLSDGRSLLAGKSVTALSNVEEFLSGHSDHVPYSLQDSLEAKGANFSAPLPLMSHLEYSERLLTGQNPSSTRELAEALVRLVVVSDTAP